MLCICYNNSWGNCKCCCSSPTGTLCMTKLYFLSWLEAPELRLYCSGWPAVPSLYYPHSLQNKMWQSTRRYPCPCKLLDTELCKADVRSWTPCPVQDATKYSTSKGAHAPPALAYYLLALVSNIYHPKPTLAQNEDNHLRMRKEAKKTSPRYPSEKTPGLNQNNWHENPTPLILLILGLKYGSKKGQASSIC